MRKLLMLLFVILFISVGFGQDNDQTFENGNTAYNAGQFEKALLLYKKILESGEHSAALYFNMGNCYYRLNNVAESIFFFEKAKQLNPFDEDISINSAFAQNMAIDAVEMLPISQVTKFKDSLVELFNQEGWALVLILLSWLLVIFWGLCLKNKTLTATFMITTIDETLNGIIVLSLAKKKFANTFKIAKAGIP